MNLKNVRIKNNLTQLQLAGLIGVDVSTVTKWETGNSYPRAEMLPGIARTLGCSIDELFSDEEREAG